MKQKVGEFFRDVYPANTIIRETPARTDFTATRDHAITLVRIHDQATGGGKGRPPQELEALKRSALILAVTAWESFVEDSFTERVEAKLKAATSPADLQSTFNAVGDEWLDPQRSPKRHGPDLIAWAGERWKDRIRDSLRETLESFHTPNTDNTNKLFKRYVGVTIKNSWSWQAVSPTKAQGQLDKLIKLRGTVVHRGKTGHPLSAPVRDVGRQVVIDALNLVYFLVHTSENALGVSPSV